MNSWIYFSLFVSLATLNSVSSLTRGQEDRAVTFASGQKSIGESNSTSVNCPKALLIGDSISMGYTSETRRLLKGTADVQRIPANGGPTTRGLANIDKWLGDSKWDVIHFNWGIHDLKIMPNGKHQVEAAEYQQNLRKLVSRLKKTNAKLIWASTTPIPKGKLNPDRRFGDETVYNRIAATVMKDNDIPINDLHGYIMPRFDEFHKLRDLHFKTEGSVFLAKKVASEIQRQLAR